MLNNFVQEKNIWKLRNFSNMQAEILVDTSSTIGDIDKRIYGQFIEHLGECIYPGIWVGESSKIPNIKGFRKDVLDAIKRLKPPIIRWPGGNFSSGYHWEDGIGPRDKRPKKLELAWNIDGEMKVWNVVESNQFGTCEFIELCRLIGAQPFITVNAGNGSPEEAARWVEYCNFQGDTYYASMRKMHGYPESFGVKLWSVGNELYGEWQIGYCLDGVECARRTIEFVNEMKRVDPTIEIVAVGCDYDAQWNIDMVKHAGKYFDYLSIHRYAFTSGMTYHDLIAEPFIWENILHTIYGTVEMTRVRVGLKKEIKLAFDEWNVWYPEAKPPMLKQNTSVKDALFTGLVLNMLHRLCREVPIACFAQTVNVLPLIMADFEGRMFVNPQYLAFKLFVDSAQDSVVKCLVDSPSIFLKKLNRDIDLVQATATFSKSRDKLTVHLVNLSENDDAVCKIQLKGFKPKKAVFRYVSGKSLDDKNTFDNPNNIIIEEDKAKIENDAIEIELRRHSVASVLIEGLTQ